MAKTSSIAKNNRRGFLIKKYEKKRSELKSVIMNKASSAQERFEAQQLFFSLPRDSARVRYRNRCVLTGRPRAFYRDFGISRIVLREKVGFGLVPGVIKSSW